MLRFLPEHIAAALKPRESAAPKGPLSWHADLVDRLTAEHWRMLALCRDAILLFRVGYGAACVDALGKLNAIAREYHVQEQSLLFAYLDQELAPDDERRAQLQALRAGWPTLRDALAKATRDVAAAPASAAERTALEHRLDALAESLRHRFETVENGPFVSYAPAWSYALAF